MASAASIVIASSKNLLRGGTRTAEQPLTSQGVNPFRVDAGRRNQNSAGR
jgi:hypothetical protein